MLSSSALRQIDIIRTVAPQAPGRTFESLSDLRAALGRPLRVAVARLDGIGDWVLSMPLIDGLRRSEYVDSVSLLSVPAHRTLLDTVADNFVELPLWSIHHTPWPHGSGGKVLAISRIAQVRARRYGERFRGEYDIIVLPRWDIDRGQNLRFFAAGTGAVVAGHDPSTVPQASPKEQRESRSLNLRCRDVRAHAHESDRLLALMQVLGLDPQPGAGRRLFGLPPERGRGAGIVLHTSAHDAFREWPTQRWRELVSALLQDQAEDILLVGSPADRSTHDKIVEMDSSRVRSLAGEVGLRQLPELLDSARLFIGNDSGPAHLAGAVGMPVIVISCFPEGDDPDHPNSPDRFAPHSDGGVDVFRPGRQRVPFAQMAEDQRDALIGEVRAESIRAAAARVLRSGLL